MGYFESVLLFNWCYKMYEQEEKLTGTLQSWSNKYKLVRNIKEQNPNFSVFLCSNSDLFFGFSCPIFMCNSPFLFALSRFDIMSWTMLYGPNDWSEHSGYRALLVALSKVKLPNRLQVSSWWCRITLSWTNLVSRILYLKNFVEGSNLFPTPSMASPVLGSNQAILYKRNYSHFVELDGFPKHTHSA